MKRLFVFFVIVFVGAYASAQTMQVSVEDAIMAMQVRVGLNAGCENVSAVGMNVLRNSRGDTGAEGQVTDVAELTVLTMHGQTAMRAEQTGSVNIHALSVGTYMVRIKTFAGKTEYLKLTKK